MTETTAPVQSLHDQIMRLPCTPPKDANVNQSISYKSGHRDARHAAAELAAEHEAEQQQELTAIEAMARMLADGEWAEHVGMLGGPIAQRLETEITRMHNEQQALIAQQAAPVAVPDGWKPVPVRPTIEMVEAGYEASLGEPDRSGSARVIDQYEAMLSAAPTPPAGQGESPCTPPAQQSHVIRAAYEVLLGCIKRPEIAALIDTAGVEKIAKQLNNLLPGHDDTAAPEPETDKSIAADCYESIADVLDTESGWSVLEHVEWMKELLGQASEYLHDIPESAVGGSDRAVELCRRMRLCLAGKAPGYLEDLPAEDTAPEPTATAREQLRVRLEQLEQPAVKVPRELLERAANRFSKAQIFDFASELRAML